jgi:glycosyltransferase involved in cell wall biosynthesis
MMARRIPDPRIPEPRVAVLLATYNGAPWLREQLDSLLRQTHDNWVLYWRDDGSGDGSVAILQAFGQQAGQGRCVRVEQPQGRLGATGNFLTLLRSVSDRMAEPDMVAFADQDDVWLPQKLERGVAALRHAPRDEPILYCARQVLVDATLQHLGLSHQISRPTGFPAALTQNVATGCTVMLNRPGARLVAASRPSTGTLHDWWAYLLVTAAGGRLIQDAEPVVLYRQHAQNLVGAPASMASRAIAALHRGPALFMTVLREHIGALLAQPDLLSERARAELVTLDRALRSGPWRRLSALRMHGLHRQTWPETLLFRCWFLIG